MWRKKMITGTAAGMIAALMAASPVLAHGHCHRQTVSVDTSCPVCTVEGCTEAGRHTHDGHDYCGYEHECGYCDYSCEVSSDTGRGHHGCHR